MKIQYSDVTDLLIKSIRDGEGLEDYPVSEAYMLIFIREAIDRADDVKVQLSMKDICEALKYHPATIGKAIKNLRTKKQITFKRIHRKYEFRLA